MAASRAVCAGLAGLYFAICVGVVLFTSGWVRGGAGDLAVVALLTHLLGVVLRVDVRWRAAACLALALVLEFGQTLGLVTPASPTWMHMVLGATPDPVDGLLYVGSALLAIGGEWLAIRRLPTEN